VVEPSALLADDFRAFFIARREALLTRIERATGKLISREQLPAEIEQEETADEAERGGDQ
jgi:hypothetical protein